MQICGAHNVLWHVPVGERGRAGEKVGRGWERAARAGTEGERRMGWDERKTGWWEAAEQCRPGALYHGERRWTGLVPPPSPCSPLWLQTFAPSPHSLVLSVFCEMGVAGRADHSWVQNSWYSLVLWDVSFSVLALQARWPVVILGVKMVCFVLYGLEILAAGVAPPTI